MKGAVPETAPPFFFVRRLEGEVDGVLQYFVVLLSIVKCNRIGADLTY
ncbi:hypothetical protein [Gluconacetobacter sp.]